MRKALDLPSPHDVDSSLDLWVVMQRWQDILVNFSERHSETVAVLRNKEHSMMGSLPRALSLLGTFTTLPSTPAKVYLIIDNGEWLGEVSSRVTHLPRSNKQATERGCFRTKKLSCRERNMEVNGGVTRFVPKVRVMEWLWCGVIINC